MNAPLINSMLAILAFHKIGEPPHDALRSRWYISQETFRQYLKYLSENDWKVISLAALLKGLSAPDSLPPRAALLTFDDGYKRSMLDVVSPCLTEFDYPSVAFISTHFIGRYNEFDRRVEPREEICTWDDLRELQFRGFSIQSHGVRHRGFSGLIRKEQEKELGQSKSTIEAELGSPVEVFAYPYGDPGKDPEIASELLKRAGYRAACLFKGGVIGMRNVASAYSLTRVAMYPDSDLPSLLNKPCGQNTSVPPKSLPVAGNWLRSLLRGARPSRKYGIDTVWRS